MGRDKPQAHGHCEGVESHRRLKAVKKLPGTEEDKNGVDNMWEKHMASGPGV